MAVIKKLEQDDDWGGWVPNKPKPTKLVVTPTNYGTFTDPTSGREMPIIFCKDGSTFSVSSFKNFIPSFTNLSSLGKDAYKINDEITKFVFNREFEMLLVDKLCLLKEGGYKSLKTYFAVRYIDGL